MRAALILALSLAALLFAMMSKGALLDLPDAPHRVAAGGFDTDRALARLGRILGDQRPHPVDSAANDGVRDRLVAELRAMGLAPVVTDDFACNGGAENRTISCARVRNVLATIGPASGRHVLLVSHYDSTPAGPGASDDGIGVAAMLETAFLLSRQTPKRPVTFLFDEGEETGLIGARAFLERNPLAARTDTLINLESRGVTGPAIMFETDRPNGSAIAAFRRSAQRPVANSATTDFYKLIPNSTDVAVLAERREWTILNFAVIGNETRYHSPGDTLASLDRRSLAHMGNQALALTRDLAEQGRPATGGEHLYADVAGRFLVDLPLPFSAVLLFLPLFLLAVLAWRRGDRNGRAEASTLAALVAAAAFAFGAQLILGLLRPGEWWRAHPEAAAAGIYVGAAAMSLLAVLLSARSLDRERLRHGFWLVFVALGALLCIVAPGAAIFFLVPPLVAWLGMLLEPRLPGAATAAAWIACVLLFLSWAPMLDLTEILLDFDTAWLFAPLAAIIMLPVLIELKPLAERLPVRPLAAMLAAVAVLGWLPATLAPAYSADRKQKFGIEYAWHATDRQGQWMLVHDGGPVPAAYRAFGPWTRDIEAPWSTRKRWAAAAPAPPIGIPAPALDHLGERKAGQDRIVSLRLHPNGAETVRLRLKPQARLQGVVAGGWRRSFGTGKFDEDFVFRCHGRSCEGLVVELRIGAPGKVEALLMGVRTGLPEAGRALLAARPADAAPQYNADSSIAIRRVEF